MPFRSVLALAFTFTFLVSTVPPAHGKRIKAIDLELGRTDENRLPGAVYDPDQSPPVVVEGLEAAYDREAQIIRAFRFGTKAWGLNPSVDLAELLSGELQTVARTMGFPAARGEEAPWTVRGRLTDVFVESKAGFWGGLQHFAFLEVELQAVDPGGESHELRLRVHERVVNVNAGLSQRDEAAEAVARLLVEAAPEILAALNRHLFVAPPHPSIEGTLARLAAEGVTEEGKDELRAIGLSGHPEATSVLLSLLPRTRDENDRVDVIDALALLASPEAVSPLASAFATEDEDCRFMILKAMDSVGSPAALDVIESQGIQDENPYNQRRAELILNRRSDG